MGAAETSTAETVRNVCYIDPALAGNVGHHANACRNIAGEFRRRGIQVAILAHASIERGLTKELGATPVFRLSTYGRFSKRRSINFRLAQATFLADLREATAGRQFDLIYVNSILPAQMAGTIRWAQTSFSSPDMPPVVMEFGLPSGVADNKAGNWGQYTKQYQSAAAKISKEYAAKFLFFTFDQAASKDFSDLLGFDVKTLPAIYSGGEARLRTGDEQGRPVVGFLGHQRPDKGYHLVPEVLRRLLQMEVSARFLVHNGDVHETAIAGELRDLATADSRVRFDQTPADKTYWNRLLDDTDIVALPYEPGRYAASISAIAVEAVSCGLPMISPNGTTMKTLAERYQGNSLGIADWTVDATVGAIVEAIDDFPQLSRSAYAGVEKWAQENGASEFVSRLLDFADTRRPTQPSRPTTFLFQPVMWSLNAVASAHVKRRQWLRRWRTWKSRVQTE